MNAPRVERAGEEALRLRLDGGIDPGTHARVVALAQRLEADRPPWLLDVVPAYAELALRVDVERLAADRPGEDALARAEDWLRARLASPDDDRAPATAARRIEIPVTYGGDAGPDLDALAAELGMPAEEIVRRHAGADYRVAMLGFAPGFPYLLGLDPALAAPRLATPRTRVPAGSVGIGGAQTGIYPRAAAGGWRLIGRTDLVLFDPQRAAPSLLRPGDRVRFVPVRA
ncbi:5-oxoprolinase subunit PxpB [Coralloluteibacterium thermophilus]|uniref:5-oxoprolinase subunit PxpB n=1 Tax=Coralloluteibacterium thermophilum TaxID=2707049 RepID=A0ABV9NM67_9GAMM